MSLLVKPRPHTRHTCALLVEAAAPTPTPTPTPTPVVAEVVPPGAIGASEPNDPSPPLAPPGTAIEFKGQAGVNEPDGELELEAMWLLVAAMLAEVLA